LLVDITAKISGSGGFSKGAKDTNPLFDPFTDQFFYIDTITNEGVWVDPATQAVVKRISMSRTSTDRSGPVPHSLPGETMVYIGAPDRMATWPSIYNRNVAAGELPLPYVLGPEGQGATFYGDLVYIGWTSSDKVLAVDVEANRLVLYPVDGACEEARRSAADLALTSNCRGTYITPVTDYALVYRRKSSGEGEVNSKTGRIVFVARNQAGQHYLFATTIKGGEPEKITSLEENFYLIDLTE
jgi:hypothetical protein